MAHFWDIFAIFKKYNSSLNTLILIFRALTHFRTAGRLAALKCALKISHIFKPNRLTKRSWFSKIEFREIIFTSRPSFETGALIMKIICLVLDTIFNLAAIVIHTFRRVILAAWRVCAWSRNSKFLVIWSPHRKPNTRNLNSNYKIKSNKKEKP